MDTSFSSDRMDWSPIEETTITNTQTQPPAELSHRNNNNNNNTPALLSSTSVSSIKQSHRAPHLYEAPTSSLFPSFGAGNNRASTTFLRPRHLTEVGKKGTGFTPLKNRSRAEGGSAPEQRPLFTGVGAKPSPKKRTHEEFAQDLDERDSMALSTAALSWAIPGAWPTAAAGMVPDGDDDMANLVLRASHTLRVHATQYARGAHTRMAPLCKKFKSATIQTYRGGIRVAQSCKRRLIEIATVVYRRTSRGQAARPLVNRDQPALGHQTGGRPEQAGSPLQPSGQGLQIPDEGESMAWEAEEEAVRGGPEEENAENQQNLVSNEREDAVEEDQKEKAEAEENIPSEGRERSAEEIAAGDSAVGIVRNNYFDLAMAKGRVPEDRLPADKNRLFTLGSYLQRSGRNPELVEQILERVREKEKPSPMLRYLRHRKQLHDRRHMGPLAKSKFPKYDPSLAYESPVRKRQRFYKSPRTGGPVSDVRYFKKPDMSYLQWSSPVRPESSPSSDDENSDLSQTSPPVANSFSEPVTPPAKSPSLLPSSSEDSGMLATLRNKFSSLPLISPRPKPRKTPIEPPKIVVEDDQQGSPKKDVKQASTAQDASHPLFLESQNGRLDLSPARRSNRIKAKLEKERRAAEDQLVAEQIKREQEAFLERLAEEEALAEEEKKQRGYRIDPGNRLVKPLSPAWEKKVKEAMGSSMNRDLATSSNGAKVTRKDFGTLLPWSRADASHGWLNDEIIAASMQHTIDYALKQTGHQQGQTPRYHAFNSFFYSNLRDRGPESVKRWATRAKIGGSKLKDVDMVFIPVHSGAHWTLLVISPKKKTIEYFDSYNGDPSKFLKDAKLWLRQELGSSYIESEWTATGGVSPKQHNGSDCGVFLLTTAKMIMLGWDPEKAYNSKDMATQRKRIAAELMNGGLSGEFEPQAPDGRWD